MCKACHPPLTQQLLLPFVGGMHHLHLCPQLHRGSSTLCGDLMYALESVAWQSFSPVTCSPLCHCSAGRQLGAWAAAGLSTRSACGVSAMLLALAHLHTPCQGPLEAVHFSLGFVFFKARNGSLCNNCTLYRFYFLCFRNGSAEDILIWLFFMPCWTRKKSKKGNASFLEFDYFCKIFVRLLFRTFT